MLIYFLLVFQNYLKLYHACTCPLATVLKVLKLTPPLSRHLMKFAPTFRSTTTPLAIVSEKICSHNMNQKLLYPWYRSRKMCCWLTMYMVGKCLFKYNLSWTLQLYKCGRYTFVVYHYYTCNIICG
jgi:hypothetical protein